MNRYVCLAKCPELDIDNLAHCIISQEDLDNDIECPCGNKPKYEKVIEHGKMEQNLIKSELESLRKQKDEIERKIKQLVNSCKHEDLNLTGYGSAICNICNKHFHWYCPTSPTLTCEYEFINEDGEEDYDEDDCIYCHEPYERK